MARVSKIRSKGNGYTNTPAVKKTTVIYRCTRCGREATHQKGVFPSSRSPIFRENGWYVPICNVCMDELLDHYKARYTSEADAMRRLCMMCDLYWSPGLYETVRRTMEENGSGRGQGITLFRTYIGKLGLAAYNGKTFDDTLDEERIAQLSSQTPEVPKPQEQPKKRAEKVTLPAKAPNPSADTILFWGSGLTPEIYQELNLRFQRWTRNVPKPMDDGTEGLYKQLCLGEVNVMQNMAAGKNIESGQKMINDIMTKLGIAPDQQTDDSDGLGIETTPMGVWIRRWEDKRPLPEEDEDMKDENHVIRYIHTWFLGHMGKMLGIKNIYTKRYEDEIEKFKVEQPELADVDDDEIMNAMFPEKDGDDA